MIVKSKAVYASDDSIEYADHKFVIGDVVVIKYAKGDSIHEIVGRIKETYDNCLALDTSQIFQQGLKIIYYSQIISVSKFDWFKKVRKRFQQKVVKCNENKI